MAWRIGEQVVRGELDNRLKGKVTGTIWLEGWTEPLRLVLQGNPWRDWAGCLLRFTHATPRAGDITGLAPEQAGDCGDMTASRKVRLPPEPVEEWLEAGAPGKDSLPWGNSLYLEWFSESNGRVVVESTRYEVNVSAPVWSMTAEEEMEQAVRNMEAMKRFFERLEGAQVAQESEPDQSPELLSEIEELKRKASELGGGEMSHGSINGDLPLEIEHAFWKRLVAFESASRVSHRQLLAEQGFEPVSLDELTEDGITGELWRLVRALAELNTYLHLTDHLSDRELYALLMEQVLDEETEVLPPDCQFNCQISIDEYGVPGGEDGETVYLRYYADEGERLQWMEDFGEDVPPHCDPPYDRDRHLPRAEL